MKTTNTPNTTVDLTKGSVQVYPFKDLTLHVYLTNNFANDTSFLIETPTQLIAIEAPAFYEHIQELQKYITQLNKPVHNALLSYHPAGARDAYPDAIFYATKSAKQEMTTGKTKQLIEEFGTMFGDTINTNIPDINQEIEAGMLTIANVDFVILPNPNGYDIEIPALKAIYTHMLSADSHSILASIDQMKQGIEEREGYKKSWYDLVLSTHHAPETLSDVDTKISYVQQALSITQEAKTANEFLTKMQQTFPDYQGTNYLEMSAGMLYTK